ncbi:Centrosomal protein of 78 kDa [Taenia solium]|eukprot:TsM_001193400 transcript=TsM_001193400 gene=TsM_001193400
MAISPRSRSGKSPDFLKTYKFMCEQNDTGPLKRVMRHGQDRIVDGLVKARNLRFLSFENSQIGDGAVTELCAALKKTLHVMALNLSGCGISDNGIRPLVNLLHPQSKKKGENAFRSGYK